MRPDQIERIERALVKGFNVIAGDYVIHIDEDGTETEVLTIQTDQRASRDLDEALQIDAAGMRNGAIRDLVFLKSYLDSKGVTIRATSRFRISGELWDLAKDWPIQDAIVPIGGIHNLIGVTVRKAVEVNNSVNVAEFTYAP